MKITFLIETHAYEKEQLCDEILDTNLPDDETSCGIHGPEIIVPLRRNRNTQLEFSYTEETTLGEIEYAILNHIESVNHGVWSAFLVDGERYKIFDDNKKFKPLVDKYLDPLYTGIIRVGAYVSLNAGCVCKEGQLRYIIHSKELGKHNLPHVHVETVSHEEEVVLSIPDAKILAGKLPKKLLKIAQDKIKTDREFFVNCWNTLSDGLRIDMNYHYGYINY